MILIGGQEAQHVQIVRLGFVLQGLGFLPEGVHHPLCRRLVARGERKGGEGRQERQFGRKPARRDDCGVEAALPHEVEKLGRCAAGARPVDLMRYGAIAAFLGFIGDVDLALTFGSGGGDDRA